MFGLRLAKTCVERMVTGLQHHGQTWLLAALWLAGCSEPQCFPIKEFNKMGRNADKDLCTKIYKSQDLFFYSGNSFVVFSHAITLLIVKIK